MLVSTRHWSALWPISRELFLHRDGGLRVQRCAETWDLQGGLRVPIRKVCSDATGVAVYYGLPEKNNRLDGIHRGSVSD